MTLSERSYRTTVRAVGSEVELRESAIIPGYHVTSDGQVVGLLRGKGRRHMGLLREFPNLKGYLSVKVTCDRKRFRRMVHVLVALHYLPPKPAGAQEIRHLNGIKTDNRAENLAWGTARENAADRLLHGRTSMGSKHGEATRAGMFRARAATSAAGAAIYTEVP